MNLEYAFFCEDLQMHPDEVFSATRVRHTLAADGFPYEAPELFVAVGIRFSLWETFELKTIDMHMTDSDGRDIIAPLSLRGVEIVPPDDGRLFRIVLFARDLGGTVFTRPGDYQLSWLVNGIEAHSLPLRVSQAG